jgi:hypothetical protein
MNIDFINSNALIYDFEAENEYLKNEVFEMLYIRDSLDAEFERIVKELKHLEKDSCLNDYRNIYDKRVANGVVRLKEIVDRIRYYDMHIDEYRKHIAHNNLLTVKKMFN